MQLDWFDEMPVEPLVERALAILFQSPAGQGDQNRLLRARFVAQPPANLVTVHPWHADVEQDKLGPELARLLDAVMTVMCNQDFLPGQLQEHPQTLSRVNIVVDHEHAMASQIVVQFASLPC